jgi:hypothetical protein
MVRARRGRRRTARARLGSAGLKRGLGTSPATERRMARHDGELRRRAGRGSGDGAGRGERGRERG